MNEIQRKLLEKKRIDLVGKVNEEMLNYLREALQILLVSDSPPITISLTSTGGNAFFGLDMYDLLKFYPNKKIGIVHGMAYSAALFPLQACDWRTITKNGRVLLHHVTCSDIPFMTLRDPVKLQAFLKNRQLFFDCYELYSKITGKTVEEVVAHCDKDQTIASAEALEWKLVDQIIETEADVKPTW